jgi:hypothetical protein
MAREARAREIAKPWIEQGMQIGDVEMRDAAIEEIRQAMSGEDEEEAYAGLLAFLALHERDFEKESFRPLVMKFLDAEDPAQRRTAWYALFQAGARDEDLPSLWEEAEKGEMESISHLLTMWEKHDLTGKSGEVVATLLESEDRKVCKGALNGIWGAKLSSGLEERVIQLVQGEDRQMAYDAVYYALSTQANKSENSVEVLLAVVSDPEAGQAATRAAWGLNQGVPPELHERVAAEGLEMVRSGVNGYMLQQV